MNQGSFAWKCEWEMWSEKRGPICSCMVTVHLHGNVNQGSFAWNMKWGECSQKRELGPGQG